MAGCESPLANVIHSGIHCVMSKGDCMVFTDTVLETGALQSVRSSGARCGVVGSRNASSDPAVETAGCVSPQWVQCSHVKNA